MTEPKPAATVMLLRDDVAGMAVFLLRRSSRSAFMPDVFVFPGGAVEITDTIAASARATSEADAAARFAAVRETFEEAGVLFATRQPGAHALAAARARLAAGALTFAGVLTELETSVDLDALVPFSRWITPAGEPRRFDTSFYVARLPAGQSASADGRETHDGRWIAPDAALAQHRSGLLALMFPTIKHLERLAGFRLVADALAYARRKTIVTIALAPEAAAGFALPDELEGLW